MSAIEKVNCSGLSKDEKRALKALMTNKLSIRDQIAEDSAVDDDLLRAYLNVPGASAVAPTVGVSTAPKVHVRPKVQAHRSNRNESFVEVLRRPLPFKIPIISMHHVLAYPETFEFGLAEYKSSVDSWIDCFGGSTTSETTVVANDLHWQRILQVLCHLTLMLNEKDPSSQISLRPDFTALHQGMLLIKGEAKCNIKEMETAIKELIDKFHRSAYLLFPEDCPEIPGVATSQQGSSIHRIYYADGAFHEQLVKTYQFHTEFGRVEFISDIFKIAMWMDGQVKPINQFHLPPDVRMKTRNMHHITLKKEGLVKEFNHGQDYTAAITHIKAIYEAKLPNVEQGVTNCTSITITTIGRRLRDAIHLHGLKKAVALAGATSAVAQLHEIGMAHCDICVDNIFVNLDTNVVFLGDLEYCRPMENVPPVDIRRGDSAARTAQELDELQLARLQDELALLRAVHVRSFAAHCQHVVIDPVTPFLPLLLLPYVDTMVQQRQLRLQVLASIGQEAGLRGGGPAAGDGARILVKFTHTYCSAAHKVCEALVPPAAPCLHAETFMPGGLICVVMELISEAGHFAAGQGGKAAEDLSRAVIALHDNNFVHANLRE
eukprot:gene34644-41951_t